MRFRTVNSLLIAFALIAIGSISAAAQSIVTGGLAGVVTDSSGAVVAGARLVLSNNQTGQQFTATSSSSGDYLFALLQPGAYTLTVQKEGFKEVRATASVQLGTTTKQSFTLEIGTAGTTVEVSGEAPLLQTETANIATNFETKQIQEIPNPGGDVTYVAQTAPGVIMNASTGGGYGNFSTFGLPATSNLFTINGNDYNDPFLNLNNSGSSNLLLGGNELQEVSVVNNAYTGQYGRQAGSQIDYATMSGTNSWHGDLVYDWTGRFLNANDPVNNAFGGTKPFENNNQWAARLGGPIIKSKLFFFVNTEGIRYIFGAVRSTTVPTPAFQAATLANIPQDAATQAFYQNIFKLYNAAPGIANASADPACGLIGASACTETWVTNASSGNKEWLLSSRIDYSFNDNNKVFGRMKFDRGVQPTYTDSINTAFDTFSTQPQDEGQLNYTHVFSPAVVNDFIGSVLYYSAIFGKISPGAPALNLFPGNLAFIDGSMTNLGFGSGNPGGYGQGFTYPQGRNVTQWGLVDDLSIARGNHDFKMGVNFRRDDISDYSASSVAVYPAVNTDLTSFFNDALDYTQYNFAQHLIQPVAFYSFGLYFQDEFRATSNLKLTMTLRADRNSGGVCQSNCAGLPLTQFNDMAHGANIPYNQSFGTGNHTIIPNNEMVVFQPRFGLTWSPKGGNTVIRTGVGLFSDLYPGFVLSAFDTNFPQVNLWTVPGGSLAWDMKPLSSTAFPNSGVAAVQSCNTAFTNNFSNGGNLLTYESNAPSCTSNGVPVGQVGGGTQDVPNLADVSRNLKNPKYVEWNFEIQHALHGGTMFSVNYVGNRGYDELYNNDYFNGFGYGNLPAVAPDPRVGRVNFLNSGSVSNYNGVVLSVVERGWRGLSGRFSYQYSHSLDEVSNGVEPFSVITSFSNQVDPYNLRANYGPADYDARHSVTGSYVYELPMKSSKRGLDLLIGGWQLSGTMFWHSGFPFSILDGATVGALTGNNLGGAEILLQPNFTKRNFPDVHSCVVSACFGLAGSGAPYTFSPSGDFTNPVVGRNAFRGPGFLGGDMSLRKNFHIRESMDFQLGLNAYNWLNHANYGTPYPNTNAPFFGQALFTQTPPTSPYGAFAAASTDMRMAQIQAKLVF
jgi:hypothetical protein